MEVDPIQQRTPCLSCCLHQLLNGCLVWHLRQCTTLLTAKLTSQAAVKCGMAKDWICALGASYHCLTLECLLHSTLLYYSYNMQHVLDRLIATAALSTPCAGERQPDVIAP